MSQPLPKAGPHSAKAITFTAAEARQYQFRLRLLTYVASNGCWEWSGGTSKGYTRPHIAVRQRPRIAARVSYAAFVGPIDAGLLVCHSCDNELCVNPAHLWLGDSHANNLDAYQKGRRPSQKGGGNGHAILADGDIPGIRAELSAGTRPADIAERFGVSPATIYLIRNRETWRHVA